MKVCHQTSGRLRLRISALHRERGVAQRLETALREQAGILAVRANPACGSLVVHYEVGTLDAPAIQDRIHALLDPSASVHGSPERPAEHVFQRWWSRARRGITDWKTMVGSLLRSRDRPPPRRSSSARAAHDSIGAPILLCRLNLRLTRWMLRTSARGWWQERFHGQPPRRVRTAAAQNANTGPVPSGRRARREIPKPAAESYPSRLADRLARAVRIPSRAS
jgi:hypothetical protein